MTIDKSLAIGELMILKALITKKITEHSEYYTETKKPKYFHMGLGLIYAEELLINRINELTQNETT